MVLELVSLVEGGQGVGLNGDVAIFVVFANFFLFSFLCFCSYFFPLACYFDGARSKGFATLGNVSKLQFFNKIGKQSL